MQLYAGIHISDGKSVNPNDLHYLRDDILILDPVKLALHWQELGATYLHIIDLDAAAMGYPVNVETIRNILDVVHIPVQYGGGLRSIKDIDSFLNMGVSRVIISTQAIHNPNFLKEAIQVFGPEKILVGIDADKGMVAVEGRAKVSTFNSLSLAQQAEKLGVRTIVYTDVGCANMVKGPDIINTKELVDHTRLDIIYSGGVASLQDWKNIRNAGVSGVMIGAALYTNKIKLKEAVMLYERGEQVE